MADADAAGHLLERASELELVEAAIERASAGDGSVLWMAGPAGIGKTSLVAATLELAEARGRRALRARCADFERGFALGVVRQLFEATVQGLDAEPRQRLFEGAAAPAAAVLDGAAGSVAQVPLGGEASFAALNGLYWTAVRLAEEGPLVLAVDDVHWSDRPSLDWLAFLARRLEGHPILLVAATRTREPDAPLDRLERVASEATVVLEPAPLSASAVAEVVDRQVSGAGRELHAAVAEATGGNPFLVRELLRSLRHGEVAPGSAPQVVREAAPASIARAVLARLGRLDAEAVELCRALAVLGRGATLAHAAVLADQDATAAEALADELVEAGIVESVDCPEFIHPVVQNAVYGDLLEARRRALHRRAAELLVAELDGDERAAAHLLRVPGTGDPRSVEVLRRAGERALRRGAPGSAVRLLSRAVEEPPPETEAAAVLLELGRAQSVMNPGAAVGHLAAAAEHDDDAGFHARVALARWLPWLAEPERGMTVARTALAGLPGEDPRRAQAEAAFVYCSAFHAPAREEGEQLARRLYDERGVEDAIGLDALRVLLLWEVFGGESPEPWLEPARQALATGAVERPGAEHLIIALLAPMWLSGRLDEATVWLERAFEGARVTGSLTAFVVASLVTSDLDHRRGELARAEAHARQAKEVLAAMSAVAFRYYVAACLAAPLLDMGRAEEARREAEELGLWGDVPDQIATFDVLAVRGRTRLALGDLDGAVADLRLAGERAERWGRRSPMLTTWRSDLAQALMGTGEREESALVAAEELRLARRVGAPRAIGRSLRLLAAAATERDEAMGLLKESVEVLRDSPARLELAASLVELGSVLRRANRRADAREPLREGLDLAVRCGAAPLADRAETELASAGARPRRRMLTGVEALTPSELRTAELAASGLSNPEIAERVFVTRKTVEAQLSAALRKLEVDSRESLAEALQSAVGPVSKM